MSTSTTTVSVDEFLAQTAEPVREQLGASVDLREFLNTAGALTLDERRLIVAQALILLEQNYAHLPLKVAMHAVNPVQRLRLVRSRLARETPETMGPELAFHSELLEIFHSVRDLHTNYLLPQPYAGKIAYLPFLIEEYVQDGAPRYLVTRVVQGFAAPGLAPGAEVTYWNGMPIGRAVDVNAARFAGSNAAARHSRGLESLTIRSLRLHLPPDEEWVTVTFLGDDGTERELRQKWLVTENLPSFIGDMDAVGPAAASMGLDLGADETGRGRKLLYAPQVVAQERAEAGAPPPPDAAPGADLPTSMAGVFRARSVTTAAGTFGHIRIFTFAVDDPARFVREFVRLIGLLPQSGLIVDVRGNGGGHIHASEFTLQTLTPRRIAPEPVQFIATPLNLRICSQHRDNPSGIDLGPWFPSLERATETGATFSDAHPITPEVGANAIGQTYQGPVVLVTDARCYSATDIFAAGFQDHEIGKVLGVDGNTGAGGANVWTQGLLMQLLQEPAPDAESPYEPLPQGVGMRVSIRRTLRVGARAGTPVEDLGVVPDVVHSLTRDDLLNGNVDLLEEAGRILAAEPARRLEMTASLSAGGDLEVVLEGSGVDRADVYVDGRPRASADLGASPVTVTVPGLAGAERVRADGFDAGALVITRAVDL